MKLQKIIVNGLLGAGLIGFLGCGQETEKNPKKLITTETEEEYSIASFPSSYSPSVAVGDMNGDGKLDIVVAAKLVKTAIYNPAKIYVLLNNGDGTYSLQKKE